MLQILIDHDNISPPIKDRGSYYIVDRILSILPQSLLTTISRAECRFYGGWFSGVHLTNRAQMLAANVARDFPTTMTPRRIPVSAELARSLLIDPSSDLCNTFRTRQNVRAITFKHPINQGCRDASCPLMPLTNALTLNKCPTATCAVKPRDLLEKNEQKLVDSMMVVDALFVAQALHRPVVLVSSDDDLWPPIHSLLVGGDNIFLVHTAQRTTPYASIIKSGWGTLWQGTL